MEKPKITYTAKYEIVIHYDKGVELGFFADKMPDEEDSKTTFVRVEHGEPDAGHGILELDFKKQILHFGYDILYVERPFTANGIEDDGSASINAGGIDITIKKRGSH